MIHLKAHTLHMFVQKNTQNDSIKCELKKALYIALEDAPKISLKEALKITKKKGEEKTAFEIVLDGPLDGAIKGATEGTAEGAPKVSLSDLHKDDQESAFEVAPKILL